jgi:hypothetical protein
VKRGPRHERRQRSAERHARGAHEDQHEQDAVELPVDLVQRARHLNRAAAGQRTRQHAQVRAGDGGVGELLAGARAGDLARAAIDRDDFVRPRPPDDVARGQH